MSKKNNVVKLSQIKQKIEWLKEEGKKDYRPKYGRQIAKLEKEYKKVA
tara:strand:+ start:389 stop:532 length:144 start_codon:yes stop_codon:yes gene_type:complete